jgi:hypothetical protein
MGSKNGSSAAVYVSLNALTNWRGSMPDGHASVLKEERDRITVSEYLNRVSVRIEDLIADLSTALHRLRIRYEHESGQSER